MTAEPEQEAGIPAPRDVDLLSSLPGVGRVVLATRLTDAPDLVARRDDQALRGLTGVAPVTTRAGKTVLVVRRLATHPRRRHAVSPWARVALPPEVVSKTKDAAGWRTACSVSLASCSNTRPGSIPVSGRQIVPRHPRGTTLDTS